MEPVIAVPPPADESARGDLLTLVHTILQVHTHPPTPFTITRLLFLLLILVLVVRYFHAAVVVSRRMHVDVQHSVRR